MKRSDLLYHAALVALLVLFLCPFFWLVSTSFKTDAAMFRLPPQWLPEPVTFDHYREVFLHFSELRWIDTFLPLTLPEFFGSAFFIFLLRQFFATLPEELLEAARLDGASEWQIFARVVLPLSRPARIVPGRGLAWVSPQAAYGQWA